jgi:hypothetical protein
MTKLRQRMSGTGVPTQSQPQAAPLTLSACNVAIHVHKYIYIYLKNSTTKLFTELFCCSKSSCGRIALHA